METYAIEADGHGQFSVRATRDDGHSRIAGRFPTLEQAQQWIDAQVQNTIKTAISSDLA